MAMGNGEPGCFIVFTMPGAVDAMVFIVLLGASGFRLAPGALMAPLQEGCGERDRCEQGRGDQDFHGRARLGS